MGPGRDRRSAGRRHRYIFPDHPRNEHTPELHLTQEETLSRRRLPSCALLVALAAGAGCDRLPEAVIFPEFDLSYSFESGLEGWTVSSADVGNGSGTAEPSSERASEGARSVRLVLANPGAAGKLWITRELELTPGKRYTAEITFDLATTDHGLVEPWKLIVGTRPTPPETPAALDFQGDTSSGLETSAGVVWVQKRLTVPAQSDEEGRLYLTVGVWGTTAGNRTYWLDNVRIILTRTE